jgi:cobalt-zinc-cadmium efflux system outer membrane protein
MLSSRRLKKITDEPLAVAMYVSRFGKEKNNDSVLAWKISRWHAEKSNTLLMRVVAIIIALSSGSVFALALTLQEATLKAKENSPDIQQLNAQYNSAVQKTWLAIAPAEPTLSISENDMTKSFHLGTAASKVIQFQQVVGFPGRAWLNRSQLHYQAEAIRYQLRAMELQVSVNLKSAYFNLQLAQKNIQLNDDTKLAFERIMEIAKRRYESGAAAQVDFINAQVALLSNENDLADLLTAEKIARAQLNVFLKLPIETAIQVEPIKMTKYSKIDLAEAGSKMMEHRNELNAVRATESSTEKAYKLAWMSLLPDFQFTLGTSEYRMRYASPYSSVPDLANAGQWPTRTYSAGVQITIPLWFMFNERAVISGASSDRAAAQYNVDIVYNQSKVALEAAVEKLNSTEEKIANFEKRILPLSDQAFKLALLDYSSGKVDFQTLASTATSRRQARLSYATAVVNYLSTYATYGQLIGEEF